MGLLCNRADWLDTSICRLIMVLLVQYIISVVFTSVIAALTVGGKALGKTFAISYSKDIIFQVGKVLQFVENKFHITIIKDKKDKKRKK